MTDIISAIQQIDRQLNSVIVYDIDGTLLDSFGGPRHDIVQTYKYAIRKGIPVVIITARIGHPDVIRITQEQLLYAGVNSYMRMYFMPANRMGIDQARLQTDYKLNARKNLHESGYKVEISIGDMPWDIGEYGGKGFLV